jgi:hypothetical protein
VLKGFQSPQPHARVATAVLAFVIALIVRPVVRKNRFTGVLISVTMLWFAINVLVAAYSSRMRQDSLDLRFLLH